MASLCSFLETTERRFGTTGLLELFGDLMTLDKIPDFTSLIMGSPDLLTTCVKAADNNNIVSPIKQRYFISMAAIQPGVPIFTITALPVTFMLRP